MSLPLGVLKKQKPASNAKKLEKITILEVKIHDNELQLYAYTKPNVTKT